MADALVSPAVGGTLWAATTGTALYCAKRVREERDESKIPLMGVVGAFVFAAQMLNFQIPGTGSSGHLGGGLILAVLLGPHAAFLVMTSVLAVQALFFADGGLLALGANVFNLGFLPAFIAYPVYRAVLGRHTGSARAVTAAVIAAFAGLGLGALGVVLETTLSGLTELPFATFAAVMLPIHIPIAMVEGLVTAGVISFVRGAQPELLDRVARGEGLQGVRLGRVLLGFLAAALIAGAGLSWYASADPDGLEWSIARIAGSDEVGEDTGGDARETAAEVQARTALMPDYELPETATRDAQASTGVAGAVGAGLTLAVAALIGWALHRRARRSRW